MGIHEKLKRIQTEIKAPKNLYNSFGKYKYRNAEGICEAVKPFLARENCTLILSDEIKATESSDRIYIKAIATLADTETMETVTASAFAREPIDKKGMDPSQVTGTASSYARKYALNGLFLLDDTKDADTDEYHEQTKGKKKDEPRDPNGGISEEEYKEITAMVQKANVNEEALKKQFSVQSLIMLSYAQYSALKNKLEKAIAAKES